MEAGDLAPSDNEQNDEERVGFTANTANTANAANESELNRHKRMPSMVRAETSDGIPKYQEYTRTSVLVPNIKEENSSNKTRGRTDSFPTHYNNVNDDKSCTFSKVYYHPGMMSFTVLIISGLVITCFLISNGELIWDITGYSLLVLLVLYLLSLCYYGYKLYKDKNGAQNKWSPRLATNHHNDIENDDDDNNDDNIDGDE